MNPIGKRLRARIAAVPKQERGGRRYGAELKRAVVEYAFARQDEGATVRVIAGELGLSTGPLGKWLRHARRRLEKGRVPFAPGEPPPMPWRDPEPAAESSAAGSSCSQTEPVTAGAPPSVPSASRGPASGRRVTRRRRELRPSGRRKARSAAAPPCMVP
jgi:transposase-like protein